MRAPCIPFALAGALLAACSPPQPPPPEPPHILFHTDAQSLENPFPDARLVSAEGTALRPDWYRPFFMQKALTSKMTSFLQNYTAAAVEITGVGNFGETLLRTSAPIDPSSVGPYAARLRKTAQGYEVIERDVIIEHSTASLEGTEKTPPADYPEFLVVRPTAPLREGEEGLLVVLRGLRTTDGQLLERGFAWAEAPGNSERATAAAAALGVGPEEILIALEQRAARVTPVLRALQQWTVSAPAPTFVIPPRGQVADPSGAQRIDGAWKNTDPEWSQLAPILTKWPWSNPAADVGQVIVGSYKARDLREDGVWTADWVSDPGIAPQVDLVFVLTLPAGAKPQGGYRVVIGAHGMNGRNTPLVNGGTSFCLEVAQVLAAQGLGCLGIDAPSHGTRGNSFDFFAVEDLRKARDNFRQMLFDQMQLVRLARVLDVDADGQPDLSSELGYFGNSLGGIMGANLMSIDPRVKYGVLNVAGGGLATILTSVSIRDQVGLLLVARTGMTFASTEYYQAFPMFRTIGQLFLEPGDPVNVGGAFRDVPSAVLVQEGLNDTIVANVTTENLARAMGLEVATSSVSGSAPLRVLSRTDPVRFGKSASFNGHNIFWEIEAARTEALTFLRSSGTQLVLE